MLQGIKNYRILKPNSNPKMLYDEILNPLISYHFIYIFLSIFITFAKYKIVCSRASFCVQIDQNKIFFVEVNQLFYRFLK